MRGVYRIDLGSQNASPTKAIRTCVQHRVVARKLEISKPKNVNAHRHHEQMAVDMRPCPLIMQMSIAMPFSVGGVDMLAMPIFANVYMPTL